MTPSGNPSLQTLHSLLLVNIRQLLTLRSHRPGPRRGPNLKELAVFEDGAVLCHGGRIVCCGKTRDAMRDPWIRKNRKKIVEIDCSGQVVLPGFVDSHTHPAFITPRLVDFEKRIAGATYEQIAQGGGGIRSSVDSVRKASRGELAGRVLDAFREMARQGTTTVEAKSGYGLTAESEIKSLQAIGQAARRWPGTIVPTLLGGHVLPKEYRNRSQAYVDIVCKEMIPRVAKLNLARFIDVFTERGAFSLQETARIFDSAKRYRLGLRAHLCQLSETPLRSLLNFNVTSLDHLDQISEADISLLAKTDTIATLLPGANYFLGLGQFPPARRLIDSRVAVALATDYNPGSSPTTSMPFVLSLACTHMKMSPAEAISAATFNGAWALRLQERKGSIELGKDADLAIFDVPDYREIPYWFASNRCAFTVLNGVMNTTVCAI